MHSLKMALKVVVAAALGIAMGFVPSSLALTSSSSPQPLLGQALGKYLGLEPQTWPVPGCQYFAEFAGDVGYCLDSVVTSEWEGILLAKRINGEVPSPLEEQILRLELDIANLPESPEDPNRRDEMLHQLWLLTQQVPEATSP
jgi:hypothetical protein